MFCKKCGYHKNTVIDTKTHERAIVRIRKCSSCGHPWRTVEKEEEEE